MVSAILYALLMLMLYRKRHEEPFHNSFFKLFITLGIADMGSLLTHYPLCVFRHWDWVSWAYFLENESKTIFWCFAAFGEATAWGFGAWQYVGITIMTVNRLRLVKEPLEIWSDNVLKLCYLLQLGVGALAAIPNAFMTFTVEKQNNVTLIVTSSEFKSVYILSIMSLGSFLSLVCAGLYIAICVAIRKSSLESVSNNDSQERKSAIRLAFLSSVLFILMSGINGYLVTLVVLLIFGLDTTGMHLIYGQWVIIFDMVNPWLLLICSKPVRKKFIKFTGIKFHNTVRPTG